MNNILEAPLVGETRRNHALEHATIHILSERFPGRTMAGHSNPTGFFLIGDFPTEHVREAVIEALTRLQNGESQLAIHAGCGTNYVVTGGIAAIFAYLGMSGTKNNRERFERIPLVMLLSILAFMIGQPLGPALQKEVTTQPDPGGMTLEDVYLVTKNVHRVVTRP
ncbi:MAG: DUF6391 domain-containing protein [Chloroflexi bacterium]|nr:DUF6391 domain-containing protein [Chloroflexota bacterium]